jgi:phage tail sheath protein FI
VYDEAQSTLLYGANIAYIRKFAGRGIAFWEQNTLYQKNSALQFLNVRVLCNILKRAMYDYLLYGLQEPGDDILRKQLQFGLEDYLRNVKANRGISDFRVVIDDTNNSPALVNSGILAVSVVITPILAVREIALNLIINKSGVTLTEQEIAAAS